MINNRIPKGFHHKLSYSNRKEITNEFDELDAMEVRSLQLKALVNIVEERLVAWEINKRSVEKLT